MDWLPDIRVAVLGLILFKGFYSFWIKSDEGLIKWSSAAVVRSCTFCPIKHAKKYVYLGKYSSYCTMHSSTSMNVFLLLRSQASLWHKNCTFADYQPSHLQQRQDAFKRATDIIHDHNEETWTTSVTPPPPSSIRSKAAFVKNKYDLMTKSIV